MADVIEASDLDLDCKVIERQYWDMVEHQMGTETLVEYAADISTQHFGSGFGR